MRRERLLVYLFYLWWCGHGFDIYFELWYILVNKGLPLLVRRFSPKIYLRENRQTSSLAVLRYLSLFLQSVITATSNNESWTKSDNVMYISPTSLLGKWPNRQAATLGAKPSSEGNYLGYIALWFFFANMFSPSIIHHSYVYVNILK